MEKRKEKVREFEKSVERRIELFVSESIERENELNNDQEEEAKVALDQNEETKVECRRAIKDRKIGDFCSRKRKNKKKRTDINPNATDLKEKGVDEGSLLNPNEENTSPHTTPSHLTDSGSVRQNLFPSLVESPTSVNNLPINSSFNLDAPNVQVYQPIIKNPPRFEVNGIGSIRAKAKTLSRTLSNMNSSSREHVQSCNATDISNDSLLEEQKGKCENLNKQIDEKVKEIEMEYNERLKEIQKDNEEKIKALENQNEEYKNQTEEYKNQTEEYKKQTEEYKKQIEEYKKQNEEYKKQTDENLNKLMNIIKENENKKKKKRQDDISDSKSDSSNDCKNKDSSESKDEDSDDKGGDKCRSKKNKSNNEETKIIKKENKRDANLDNKVDKKVHQDERNDDASIEMRLRSSEEALNYIINFETSYQPQNRYASLIAYHPSNSDNIVCSLSKQDITSLQNTSSSEVYLPYVRDHTSISQSSSQNYQQLSSMTNPVGVLPTQFAYQQPLHLQGDHSQAQSTAQLSSNEHPSQASEPEHSGSTDPTAEDNNCC